MNNVHKQRLWNMILIAIGFTLAVSLILYALKQNIHVFLTPSQVSSQQLAEDYHLRLGGVVKKNSLRHDKKGLGTHFIVTDFKHDLPVYYQGILPDLFRENKGVIAEGSFNAQGVFIASQVLAKHDENYMPRKGNLDG